MERKIRHIWAKLEYWRVALDRATDAATIGRCLRMIRLYEDAVIALEEAE